MLSCSSSSTIPDVHFLSFPAGPSSSHGSSVWSIRTGCGSNVRFCGLVLLRRSRGACLQLAAVNERVWLMWLSTPWRCWGLEEPRIHRLGWRLCRLGAVDVSFWERELVWLVSFVEREQCTMGLMMRSLCNRLVQHFRANQTDEVAVTNGTAPLPCLLYSMVDSSAVCVGFPYPSLVHVCTDLSEYSVPCMIAPLHRHQPRPLPVIESRPHHCTNR